jgi:catechol 2,3-dioxygenase-like lactoylglutathione lyase family enzyme
VANVTGRPIAPARKLVAAVLGTIALFVMVFGLGMSSWAIVALGAALLALAIALGMVNVVRRGARAWIAGQGQVKAVSDPPATAAYGRAELQITVVAPGLPVQDVVVRDPRVPVSKWPLIGDTVPLTVDVDDMRRVRIDWDQVTDRGDDGDPPPPPSYEPADSYLEDDLLGEPEPPPWAARDRQWGRGPDEPPPPPPPTADPDLLTSPIVVHDTPGGPVLEGQLVAPDDDPQVLPKRARQARADVLSDFPAAAGPSAAADFAAAPPASAYPSQAEESPFAARRAAEAAYETVYAEPIYPAEPVYPADNAYPTDAAYPADTAYAAESGYASAPPYVDQPVDADEPSRRDERSFDDERSSGDQPSPTDERSPDNHPSPDDQPSPDVDRSSADRTASTDDRSPADQRFAAEQTPGDNSPSGSSAAGPAAAAAAAGLSGQTRPPGSRPRPRPHPPTAADAHPGSSTADSTGTATEDRSTRTAASSTAIPDARDPEIDLPLDGDPEPPPEFSPAARPAVDNGILAPPAAASAPRAAAPPPSDGQQPAHPDAPDAERAPRPPATISGLDVPPDTADTAGAQDSPTRDTDDSTTGLAGSRAVSPEQAATAAAAATTAAAATASRNEPPAPAADRHNAAQQQDGPLPDTDQQSNSAPAGSHAISRDDAAAFAAASHPARWSDDPAESPPPGPRNTSPAEQPSPADPAPAADSSQGPPSPTAGPSPTEHPPASPAEASSPAEPSPAERSSAAEPSPADDAAAAAGQAGAHAVTPPDKPDRSTGTRRPWADLEGGGYEPDERADDLITAYPSARPGPAGAIHGVGITVLVTDLARSVAFYRDTLGFFEIDTGSGSAVMASGDTRLVLRTVQSLASDVGRLINLNLEVGDVQAVHDELKAKGVKFEHGPRPVNRGDKLELWAATFYDPDGHNIAITQWRAVR